MKCSKCYCVTGCFLNDDLDTEEEVLQAINIMIAKLVKLWPRATGNGWDIPNVHAQFHVP